MVYVSVTYCKKRQLAQFSIFKNMATLILQRSIMELCKVIFESLETKLILRCDNSNESCWTVNFPVVLLIMLYKVVFTFESSDEIFLVWLANRNLLSENCHNSNSFQHSTKLKLGISFFTLNIWLLQLSSKGINSNTVTKTLITELDILSFNQRFFACLRGISCDFPWKFELWQADCIQIIHAMYMYSGGGVSLPCTPFFGCHGTLWGRLWCSLTASDSAFIIINFLSPYRVCAVHTQGRHTPSWFVSTYRVTDSLYKSS